MQYPTGQPYQPGQSYPAGQQYPPPGQPFAPGQQYPPGGPPPAGYPGGAPTYPGQVPGGFLPPEPPKRTNGFAITSLIFGIIGGIPLGLIFGIIGLVKSNTYRSGKVMSWIGIVLSVLWIIPIVAIATAASHEVNKVLDPGCVAVESNIAALNSKISADTGNTEAFKADLQSMVADLQDGAAKTHSDTARSAMNAMASDVQQVLDALNGNGTADAALGRLQSDGNAIDAACGR
jgi:hypothetical protein